ncbi:hypothetical protein [Candidatus Uabimicrobium amorphum]|uniref:Uncharacterized protein n=1 Tax=Uabimicrobium amorphum TaxID=2596890 RepID=A0A5S9F1A3_UABAM|nr:hypothetical protein [Candidatus Uabimicrobium amorphum]BBM82445.1 hypothetical protein UABAM_00788 [Candidatus Uabimicrobium amorphum]
MNTLQLYSELIGNEMLGCEGFVEHLKSCSCCAETLQKQYKIQMLLNNNVSPQENSDVPHITQRILQNLFLILPATFFCIAAQYILFTSLNLRHIHQGLFVDFSLLIPGSMLLLVSMYIYAGKRGSVLLNNLLLTLFAILSLMFIIHSYPKYTMFTFMLSFSCATYILVEQYRVIYRKKNFYSFTKVFAGFLVIFLFWWSLNLYAVFYQYCSLYVNSFLLISIALFCFCLPIFILNSGALIKTHQLFFPAIHAIE